MCHMTRAYRSKYCSQESMKRNVPRDSTTLMSLKLKGILKLEIQPNLNRKRWKCKEMKKNIESEKLEKNYQKRKKERVTGKTEG